MTSVSFENLFRTLPSGVVSKKDIGSRIVFFRRPLCRFLADLIAPIAKIMAAVKSAIPKSKEIV